MPAPAIIHAMAAPTGPVAFANVRGNEKMPAPIMPPTTMAVSCKRLIFCTDSLIGVLIVSCCNSSGSASGRSKYRVFIYKFESGGLLFSMF
jgi:hypothetical protein